MIGKIFYNNEWHLIEFNKNSQILSLLKSSPVEAPFNQKYEFSCDRLLPAYMEDGDFYIFDIESGQKSDCIEFVDFKIQDINYFIQPKFPFKGPSNDNLFKKVVITNGALKSIISDVDKDNISFDVCINDINVNIKFYIKEEKNFISFQTTNGATMLSYTPDKISNYNLEINFETLINIQQLNNIIDSVYKLIEFLNFEHNPYIENIQVENQTCKLNYFYKKINYNKSFQRIGNYISNLGNNIKKLLDTINNPNFNLDFLDTLNSLSDLDIRDIWKLSNSIEAIADEYDPSLESEFSKEIKYNTQFADNVKDLIDDYRNDGKLVIDNDDENSIISCLKITRFRKKVENLIATYNNFAKIYKKYPIISDAAAIDFSKRLSELRNTIHGKNIQLTPQDTHICALMVLSLYLYILDKCGCTESQIFNFVQSMFQTF